MPNSLFVSLPGISMRVADVMPALARQWEADSALPDMAVRASQMNLVLHFGVGVGADDARKQWEAALSLSQKYPCRIIILSPEADVSAQVPMQGKLHIGCFFDEGEREHRCCEILTLAYPQKGHADLLENQLSVWRESDLPTYHWFHGIDARTIMRDWLPLVKKCRRVLFDSSQIDADFSEVPWPRPDAVRDLAKARLLPVRQAIGQFLSAYQPTHLVQGLENVRVHYAPKRRGESIHFLNWMKTCLTECARSAQVPLTAEFSREEDADSKVCLAVDWHYTNGNSLHWEHASEGNYALLDAVIDGTRHTRPLRVPFLDAPQALAEALFF